MFETAARGVERRVKLRDALIVADAEEAPFCFEEAELELSAQKVQLIYAAHDIQDESELQDEGPAPSARDGLETRLLLQDGKRISGIIQLRKGETRYTALNQAFIALAWAEIESFSPQYQSFHTKSVLVNRAYIESFGFPGGRED